MRAVRSSKRIRSLALNVNRALQVYLGCDAAGGYDPIGDHEKRLRRAYPFRHRSARSAVDGYLREASDFDYPIDAPSLSAAADMFAEAMRHRFPELDAVTVRCLASRFAYNWK
jgi:hypothetical protein